MMISRALPTSDISQRELQTWNSKKNLWSTAIRSQETNSGSTWGSALWEDNRAPLQNENKAVTRSLLGMLHWDIGKVKSTPYPAGGWARVRMSNVTEYLSMLATTAFEANISCWLLQHSLFLPASPMLQRKASSDLCTLNQSWAILSYIT